MVHFDQVESKVRSRRWYRIRAVILQRIAIYCFQYEPCMICVRFFKCIPDARMFFACKYTLHSIPFHSIPFHYITYIACMHCMHACMHACIDAYMQRCIHAYVDTYLPIYLPTHIHTYIHTIQYMN